MRSSEKTGQHLISHITLLTLVMAGILIAGPYVIRAWNANLKGWEDSAIDSMQDPLTEAGSGSISIQGCDPDPSGWSNEGCSLGITDYCTNTVLSCTAQEMLSTLTFSPSGCQCAIIPPPTWAVCTAEECCCTAPVSTGRCGVNATPETGLTKSDNATCPGLLPSVINKNANGTCPDLMVEVYFFCGSDDNADMSQARYGCIFDIDNCTFICNTTLQSGVGFFDFNINPGCTGETTRLPSSLPYTYTDVCTSTKCEVLCDRSVDVYYYAGEQP